MRAYILCIKKGGKTSAGINGEDGMCKGTFITSDDKKPNKTKVLSVQLGKTLCLTKLPITETEESTQVREKIWLKLF